MRIGTGPRWRRQPLFTARGASRRACDQDCPASGLWRLLARPWPAATMAPAPSAMAEITAAAVKRRLAPRGARSLRKSIRPSVQAVGAAAGPDTLRLTGQSIAGTRGGMGGAAAV